MKRSVFTPATLLAYLMLCMSLAAGSVRAAGAESVGQVIFAIGAATLTNSAVPIKKGDTLVAGQSITTGKNGHVHIRFVDDAFVSVRPNSVLKIEQYVYDPQDARNNRVRFHLSQGVARLISGEAGQSARDNFRLNTPVAAIGIRGTDFLVQAGPQTTRVAVQQGAVVISPFSNDCLSTTLGPCGGTYARQLDGSLSGQYLEVKGMSVPALIAPSSGKLPFELPRPEEPKVNPGNGNDGSKTAMHAESMNGSPQLMWGRWAGSAAVPAGYELVGYNNALILFRKLEDVVLPKTGFVDFQLKESEAYGRQYRNGYETASVSGETFSVNFEKMKYETSFVWKFADHQKHFYSKGDISDTGRMRADREASNISLSGALNGRGDEAAYIYFKNMANDLKAYGILRWER